MPLAVSAITFNGVSTVDVDERAHVRGEVFEQILVRDRALVVCGFETSRHRLDLDEAGVLADRLWRPRGRA